MPTTKPRLYLVLQPRTDAVLRHLAKLGGTPISQVANSLLDAAVPALEQMASAAEDVTNKKHGAEANVVRVVQKLTHEARDMLTELEDQADRSRPASRTEATAAAIADAVKRGPARAVRPSGPASRQRRTKRS